MVLKASFRYGLLRSHPSPSRNLLSPGAVISHRPYSTQPSITRLIQFEIPKQGKRVGVVFTPPSSSPPSGASSHTVIDLTSIDDTMRSVYELFFKSQSKGLTINGILNEWNKQNLFEKAQKVDYNRLLKSFKGDSHGWLLPPLDHPNEPAKCFVTGTGLTHLGSMEARDQMHTKSMEVSEKDKTDSQKMFEMGIKQGRPSPSTRGVQPEWFYKGNGSILRGHNDSLEIPSFTQDGGEEPEIVGCYIIDNSGIPFRIGYTVCNEWSDHEMEKVNYLWLAPSKLRECAIGPELVLLPTFQSLEGSCQIHRGEQKLYDSGVLLTGEEHMCHSLLNIEDHHFKYPQFRQPGHVHLHTYGTSKLSFPNRCRFETGDKITVQFKQMGPPLVNFVKKYQYVNLPTKVVAQQHLLKYEK